MRKIAKQVAGLGAMLLLFSCNPSGYTLYLQTRQPSPSGMEFSGKDMSVVWLSSGKDTVFSRGMAEGFAQTLEEDYYGGERLMDIYAMEKSAAGDYSSRDTLVNLVMDTGGDVVFLMDSPTFGDVSLSDKAVVAGGSRDSSRVAYASLPFTVQMYVYDSMGEDTVRVFRGSSVVRQPVFCSEATSRDDIIERFWSSLSAAGERAGRKSAETFLSQWKDEMFTLVLFSSPAGWEEAVRDADAFRWHDAMEKWMDFLDTDNMTKRSCAEYNLAMGCYMLGDYELAAKWLDLSDKDQPLSLSAGLRKRIKEKTK